MADVMGFFKVMILIQIFFSLGITILTYAMPDETLHYVEIFEKPAETINIQNISSKVQSTTQSSLKAPIVELGALVFYSGNILVDLLVNFFFAVPEMIGLIFAGFGVLFNFDTYIIAVVEGFASAIMTILYFLSVLQLLTNIRSRGSVI